MNLKVVKHSWGKRVAQSTMPQLFGRGENKQNMIKKTNRMKSLAT